MDYEECPRGNEVRYHDREDVIKLGPPVERTLS